MPQPPSWSSGHWGGPVVAPTTKQVAIGASPTNHQAGHRWCHGRRAGQHCCQGHRAGRGCMWIQNMLNAHTSSHRHDHGTHTAHNRGIQTPFEPDLLSAIWCGCAGDRLDRRSAGRTTRTLAAYPHYPPTSDQAPTTSIMSWSSIFAIGFRMGLPHRNKSWLPHGCPTLS